MSDGPPEKVEKLRAAIAASIHAHWKLFLVQGVVMMGLGLVAVALPHIATLTIEIFIGWLFFAGGLFRTLAILRTRRAPGFWLSILTAILALVLGLVLILRPFEGVLTLTMALVLVFLAEGFAAVVIAITVGRHLRNWGWTLFSGLVDFLLVYFIWQGWPGTADWAIGLLVGVNMFALGLSLTMTALAARAVGDQ